MNWIERFVYNRVKKTPGLKLFIRNCYQQCLDLLPKPKDYFSTNLLHKEGYFYGFHDTTPFSFDNSKVLANHILIPLRMPKPGEGLEVGYFKFDGNNLLEFVKLGTSYAWNYHKGCRSQWIDKGHFIFNTSINGTMKSEIVSVDSVDRKIIDSPIDTVSSDGKFATTFSYERLENYMPGYGYPYKDDISFLDDNAPEGTGLYLINLETGNIKLLVDLKSLSLDIEVPEDKKEYRHYVTHSEFSPDGRYISFMHRAVGNEIRLRWTRLLIYDLQTDKYFSLPTTDMVSHYVWHNNKILAYCRVSQIDSHVIFDIPNVNNYTMLYTNELNSDGHQTFISDNIFITDTYPDRRRVQKLYKVYLNEHKLEHLVSLYHPKKYQSKFHAHICCDFHPCASADGKYVCFDGIVNGHRSLCVLPI